MKTSIKKQMWYIHNAMENLEMYNYETYETDALKEEVFPIWSACHKIWQKLYEKCYPDE